jgi:RNA-directed DNA polymerase
MLIKRGLELNKLKTKISHICEGYDFLGFNLRIRPKDGISVDKAIVKVPGGYKYNYNYTQFIVYPYEKGIAKFKLNLKEAFASTYGGSTISLINKVNPIIRGWAQSKRAWHSNRTFHHLNNYIFNLCWRWMHRSHPNKSNGWLKAKYYTDFKEYGFNNRWTFHAQESKVPLRLLQLTWFKVERHVLIKNTASPDDKNDVDYFKKLISDRLNQKDFSLLRISDRILSFSQEHTCPVCLQSLYNDEQLHRHHIIERRNGGSDDRVGLSKRSEQSLH